jgi:exodeoxyribonuclease X
MDKSKLVFLDTETTGTSPESRLCQVAYKIGGVEFEALFKPPLPIEIEAMAVSHITNQMVADKEIFQESEMHKKLKDIFSGENILVAHNAAFDAEMLRRENIEIKKFIDTFKIAQHLDSEAVIPKYNLQYLRYYHDLNVEDAPAHNALGDIRVLEKLFDYYFDKMFLEIYDEKSVLEKMLEISARPIFVKKFNFGKYSGTFVGEVAAKDPGYLRWLLDQKTKARDNGEDNDENWIHTLEHYLGKY